jgi:hypothetical protein
MKTPRSESEWEELVRRARNDAAPPVDLPALLAAVRQAKPENGRGWLVDFSEFFNPRLVLPACLSAACVLVVVTTWQASDFSQTIPWADWIATDSGGAP